MRIAHWLNGLLSRTRIHSTSRRMSRRSAPRDAAAVGAGETLESRRLLTVLDGTHLDLGINDDGSVISATPFLGVDFGSGRDFFAPGLPIAGFSVGGIDGNGDDFLLTNNAPLSVPEIGITVIDTSAGSVKSVTATGDVVTNLKLTRTLSFDDATSTADLVVVTVTLDLANTGEETIEEVTFLENFDPDQDLATSATLNDIFFDGKLATAVAPVSPAGLTFALGTRDPDAVLSVEANLVVTDPFEVIDSPVDPDGVTADDSINIAYDIGDIDPDESFSTEYYLIFATSLENATNGYLSNGPDFGDAPDSYKTLKASGGPEHITTGPTLGLARDGEPDAEVPLSGLGDDFGGSDDEDGVTLNGQFAAGGLGSVTVNAPVGGMLDAWIDFDGSGTFDADERLGPGGSIALTAGNNTITFPALLDTPESQTITFGRFRISTAGGLGVDGAAPDGEVEDHRLTISARPDCVFVDDDYGTPAIGTSIDGGIFGFDRFTTINSAVVAVATGGTVKVHPGTYNEAVNIPKHVILNGVSETASDVVIDASGADGITIEATAATAVIRHLTVTNARDGILSATPGALTISNVVSDGQTDDGLEVSDSSFVNVANSSFSNNAGDGIELNDVGTVILTDVIANGNDPGVSISGAANFIDTDGTYSNNNDHGILLVDISGDVTLTRTTANDNDADDNGTGDGLSAEDGADGDSNAIGGSLIVRGGEYLDTDGNGLTQHQERGISVDGIAGTVLLQDSTGVVESVQIGGNNDNGLNISNTTDVTIRDASISGNAGDGISLSAVEAVIIRNVAADDNGVDGVNISDTSGNNVLIRESQTRDNGDNGIELDATGNADLRSVTASGNASNGLDVDDAGVVRVRGGSYSGIQTRDIQTFITLLSPVTSTGSIDVEANDGISLNQGLASVLSPVRLAANVDGVGGNNFTQAPAGFISTTADILITVNAGLLAGTGDANIGRITTDTGIGRITIRVGQGDIRDATPASLNLTAAEALLSALGGVGETANPIDSRLRRVEGTGGVREFVLSNTGALDIGGVDAGTTGVFGSQGVTITTASPLVVTEDVTSNVDVNLTATDGAGAGDDLTVKTTITVMAGGNVNLSAGDNLLLEDSSTVSAPAGTVSLTGDNPDADPGVGSMIDVFGTIISDSQAVITGGPDNDQIEINPGVGHTVDSTSIDGLGGGDLYRIFFGRLDGDIDINDTGTNGNDRGRFLGTPGLAESFNIANNAVNGAPQTGGTVTSVNQAEVITYTQTLERFTVRGRSENDTFNAQPSQTAEITVDGDSPTYGDPNVPPGDTLNFDSLGNTFTIDGKSILTNGGSPNPFQPVNFVDIESFPLMPLGTSDAISFDFDHSNTAASVATSPTQSGYISVVRDTLHADGAGYGWQSTVKSFERDDGYYTGPFEAMIRDGNWLGADSVFTVDLENGWYSVDVTLGNAYSSTTGQEIRNFDTDDVLATGIDSPPAVSTQATFAVLVTDGTLDLEFVQSDVNPEIFSVNAIAIRPANLLTMGLNLTGVGPLGADGVSVDTFRLHGAPPDSYVTVSIDLGMIVNGDADPEIDGVQVLTNGDGEADIMILRPTGFGQAIVKFVDINGQGIGCSALNYVLPNTRNFDYNDGRQLHDGIFQAASPTQAPVATGSFPGGFLGVLGTGLYSPASGYGWLTSPGDFDDGVFLDPLRDLLRDGASSNVEHTFRVDLPAGNYDGLATFGDSQEHDGLTLDVNGVNKVSGVSTSATERVQVPFEFTVGNNGIAEFKFSDTAGAAYWAVNGLQIRPHEDVEAFTFAPDIGAVPADGLTIATVQATTLLNDGQVVTVSTSVGTLITEDVNDIIDGVQVEVVSGGITFEILAPGTPGTPSLTATSLDGVHNTTVTDTSLLDFVLAPTRRFDFNHTYSADGPGPSITAAGFIGVLRTDTDPSTGHGWLTPPNSFDAGVPNEDDDSLSNAFNVLTTDLYRDYHSGHALLGSRTFRVQVDSVAKYDGTIYIGSQNFDASTKVTIEGIGVATVTNTSAKNFVTVGFANAMDIGADGFIDVTFEHGGGASPLWATTGLDLVEQGQPLPLPSPIVAADRQPGGHVDTVERSDIELAVDIAIAAWEDHGATAEEIALLESTPVIVRDFGRNGALGLATALDQVVIDDDGSGFGWSPILDRPTGDRYDLVTVIAHEFGHILGRADLEAVANSNELMSPYLQRGDRHDAIDGTDGFFTAAVADFLPFD